MPSVPAVLDFPGGSDSKESACNMGDPSSVRTVAILIVEFQ